MLNSAISAYAIIGFFSFALCFCSLITVICKGAGENIFPFICGACARLIVLIMSSIMLSQLVEINDVSVANLDKLKSQEMIDCSDKYTVLNTKPAEDQMEQAISTATKGIIYLSMTLVHIFCEVSCFVCLMCGCNRDCKRSCRPRCRCLRGSRCPCRCRYTLQETCQDGADFIGMYKYGN